MMDEKRQVLVGSLGRLLADHISLKYQARAFLWSAKWSSCATKEALVRDDFDRLSVMVDDIGYRIVNVGGHPPMTLNEIARLASQPTRTPPSESRSPFDEIGFGHHMILDDIGFIESIAVADCADEARGLLEGLTEEHTQLCAAYAAETGRET
jgi:DNA-binding ferritin-like protein